MTPLVSWLLLVSAWILSMLLVVNLLRWSAVGEKIDRLMGEQECPYCGAPLRGLTHDEWHAIRQATDVRQDKGVAEGHVRLVKEEEQQDD